MLGLLLEPQSTCFGSHLFPAGLQAFPDELLDVTLPTLVFLLTTGLCINIVAPLALLVSLAQLSELYQPVVQATPIPQAFCHILSPL